MTSVEALELVLGTDFRTRHLAISTAAQHPKVSPTNTGCNDCRPRLNCRGSPSTSVLELLISFETRGPSRFNVGAEVLSGRNPSLQSKISRLFGSNRFESGRPRCRHAHLFPLLDCLLLSAP